MDSSPERPVSIFIETVGWVSVVLIVLAYALLSFEQIDSGSTTYQAMNLIGAIGIIYHSLAKKDYQPAALNIVWALIAVLALVRL